MSHTVVLHIGAMKSGTSFIQEAMVANRAAMLDQGFLFPGAVFRQQVLGVLDILGQKRAGDVVRGSTGAWQRLLAEIQAHDGTSVISMEFLGATPRPRIQRVLDSLQPSRVQVVFSVRDLGRCIPAMWQEGLQNGDTWTWQEYLEGLEQGDPSQPGPARKFWRQMSVAAIAGRWLGLTGSDDFTIVTVPPPGADRRLLLERFCVAVGLDPDPLELPHRDNASLGAASAEVLRSVNARLASLGELEGERRFRRRMFVKHRLSKQGLAPHRAQESPIGFPGGHWVDARADTIISRLAGLGVRVVGDLDDLRPCPVPGVDPSEVPAVEREAAATAALAHLAELWSTLQTEPTRRT